MQPLAAAFQFGEDVSSVCSTATPGNEFPYKSGSQETERIAVETTAPDNRGQLPGSLFSIHHNHGPFLSWLSLVGVGGAGAAR